MIVYGTRASSIQNGVITNVDCPHCETNTQMNYSVFGKYAHVYWIPLFPLEKQQVIECNHCKASYELKELPKNIKQKFYSGQKLNPAKTPITHFSLLIIIGICVAFGLYSDYKTDSESADYAQNPKVGDVFFETTNSGKYSTSRVTKVTKDSVYVTLNNMEISQKSKLPKINIDGNFTTAKAAYSRKQIVDFYKDKKTIYEIQRK